MTYREQQRLADIQAAIDAIRSHLQRGDLSDGLVFDAVRIRLLEIGEAVKALPAEMLRSQPAIPWAQIALRPFGAVEAAERRPQELGPQRRPSSSGGGQSPGSSASRRT